MPVMVTGTEALLPMKAIFTSPFPSVIGRRSPRSLIPAATLPVKVSLAMRVTSAFVPLFIVAVTRSWAYSVGLAMLTVAGCTSMEATVSPGTSVSILSSFFAVARTLSSAITSLAARALLATSGTLTNSLAIFPVAASIRCTLPS